jgi:energy-converting hydrogenase Eha subunit A
MTDFRTRLNTPDPTVQLPAPTAWPVILAFGFTLVALGLVTSIFVSLFGAVFVVAGCLGWFAQVLPHQAHVSVLVDEIPVTAVTTRKRIEHIHVNLPHRAFLPVETYPVKAGIKGGIAGGLAMIIPALLYGWIAEHSIWYPVNLLGGAGVAHWRNPSIADIAAFHWQGLVVATVIHCISSVFVGLLYDAMLPMLPHRPILLGEIVAPLL